MIERDSRMCSPFRFERLYTCHRTVMYFDETTKELRHGDTASSPHNVFIQTDGECGRILYRSNNSLQPLMSDKENHIVPLQDVNARTFMWPEVNVINCVFGQFGLKLNGLFLSAEPGGKAAFNRSMCLGWERFFTKKFRFVSATRASEDRFFAETALGRSLQIYKFPFTEHRVFFNNARGLPSVYNAAIKEAKEDPAILIFIHDDVHITDYYWSIKIREALECFDIVGVAGNKRRFPGQPMWIAGDYHMTKHDTEENLSGVVGHGKGFPFRQANLNIFGVPGQEVKLIDGLMIAVDSQTLHMTNLTFDEIFDFHFYDLDFCREAEIRHLKIGTWPISLVHESYGDLGAAWRENLERYRAKWPD